MGGFLSAPDRASGGEGGPHTGRCGLLAQSLSCVQLFCDPVDCSPPGLFVHGIFQARYWKGLPFPSPGDLPDPGILNSVCLALQAKPPGKSHILVTVLE